MECPVRIHAVWKSYGTRTAVRDLTLNVPPQSVYGFLGPNGAGKSTTIRMILGLQRPDQGSISLFQEPLGKTALSSLSRIGSLVESPSLYLHLTGRENLELHRQLLLARRHVQATAIDRALDTVGLALSADRVVRGYSSGMKQRLGLAQALLGDPQLLVLDEPTNGLDPAGIHEIRALIRNLPAQRGVTVFLSSHLLADVEQVATHFAILSEGRLRFEGTSKELKQRSRPVIAAEVDDVGRASELFAGIGIPFTLQNNRLLIDSDGSQGPAELNALLVGAGIRVSELVTRYRTLEDVFLELTGAPDRREELVEAK